MSTEIQASQSFQQKMFERIKEQIGDLMTEDDLKNVVNAAMQKAFFDKRLTSDHYPREMEPLFVELIRNLMATKVEAAMKDWLDKHPGEMEKIVTDVIGQGLINIITNHLNSKASWPLQQLAEQLRQKGILT